MLNLFWEGVARAAAYPPVAHWLIRRARKTPYYHILNPEGDSVYMYRWWLFNPVEGGEKRLYPWIPFSIRIHEIMAPDHDRHMHDHPWNARTIVLQGGYTEVRPVARDWELMESVGGWDVEGESYYRSEGDTATLRHNDYHRIDEVALGGATTLFIMGRRQETWGFLVDGAKIPWRKYLGLN